MSFFNELKRRNVFRVAAAYIVIGWLLLQVATTLTPALHLPKWIVSAIALFLILGFIPAMLFSWAYELTPEGLKKDSDVDQENSNTAHTAKKLDVITLIAIAGIAGLIGWHQMNPASNSMNSATPNSVFPADDYRDVGGRVTQDAKTEAGIQNSTSSEKSIAVLPFADMSVDGDQAYFADGISEELLNVLAQVDGLKVAARTSSFKFRGDEHDIVEIGSALKVNTVLEGSVRKVGNQVRITAQLIDVAGGFHLWSETYDRELSNIFALQDEIASSIVDALKLKLDLQADGSGIQHADSGEAYDLYLRGRELAREPSKDGLTRALRFFEQALVIDPDFAAAHGAIASAWIWLEDYGGVPSQDAFDRAEPAARRALELEPNRADALTAMGFLEDRKYLNETAARDYFERAIKANPTFIEAYTLYADALRDLGETERALEVRRDAVERDPLSGFLQSRLANMLVGKGEYEEAQEILDKIFAANPNDTYAYEELGNLHINKGRLAEGVKAYTFLHNNRPGDPFAAAQIAAMYTLMQKPEKAQEWIATARARGAGNRWELNARRSAAQWTGDWDAMFRVGQLYLAKNGTTWQGQASLGKQDWEAARASFKRRHSRLNYRLGDKADGSVLESLTGLALAEKRLGIDAWPQHLAAARKFAENKLENISLGAWPNVNLNYSLAQLAAVEGDVERVVKHMQGALENNFLEYTFIKHDPFFTELRDEPRLIAIADKMREHVLAEREKLEQAE